MASYLSFKGSSLQLHELVFIAVAGIGFTWTLCALLRRLIKGVFPQGLPGEKNTNLLASPRPKSSVSPNIKDLENVVEYDYIIVGTGTAGCVLANRLSADPLVQVLAVEAGQSDLSQLFSRIPADWTKLFRTSADWSFTTTAQPECKNRKLAWPRGKMIGGCSSINAMLYNKGSPDDYDEWERLGNQGWAYNDIAPYLRKSENFTQPQDERRLPQEDLEQHGKSGPWNIGYAANIKVNKAFPLACDAVGIRKTPDVNTARGILGATRVQTFIDTFGQRCSTAVAYLTADVVTRPNLKIASGQTVTRIIFDTSGRQPRALGVEMSASKTAPVSYLAKARKEILLCAGSLGSPQLLKVSGVGPAEELKKHNIPLVGELAGVGENLMDHMAFHGIIFKTDKDASIHYLQDPIKSLPAMLQWFWRGTGDMTGPGTDAYAFIRTADRSDAPDSLSNNDRSSGARSADLELLGVSLCLTDQGRFVAPQKDGYAGITAISLRPESKGTVTLTSSSMFDTPLIDPRALTSPRDLDILLYGTRLATKIIKSKYYEPYFKGWYIGPYHPIDWDTATDDQIKEHIRATCETLWHPMGTAKMGPKVDSMAVVNHQLKVHGVQGLRVADASVFPTAIACHPCAPVVALAEKAADLIKGVVV